MIALGGHISAFRWWLGAEGERETARQIERLSAGWHCEHDVVHEHGNWDHIVVGPPGTFLLDSKYLHGRAVARDDALDCGRLKFRGSGFRGGAWRIKTELEGRLGSSPGWVQAVVVVWADFPQRLVKENDVVYIAGEDLVAWLERQPIKLKGHQRTAIISALQELRAALDQAA
ncbi:MAG TPA: nuclease-related domain-containing protein [Gaiellaceae bacterium]|nr:nuclease-related domain-containing protein [Gaiellaceae bacterium]